MRVRCAFALLVLSASVPAGAARADAVGRWSIMSTPDPSAINELLAVSCASDTFCVTVGFQEGPTGADFGTLIEQWDGTSWSAVPSPNPADHSGLLDVSCTSPTRCVAVGVTYTTVIPTFKSATLVESWDGTTWTVIPSPNDSPAQNRLNSVSCISATACVAVGSTNAENQTPLGEVWDGTSWKLARHADDVPGSLNGVSCTSAPRCIAVGDPGPLIEQRNGREWSVMPSPHPGADGLIDVTCTRAQSCVAVGDSVSGDGSTSSAAIDAWNGTDWSSVDAPSPGTSHNVLWGVSCVSANRCIAVGEWGNRIGAMRTLIESWDGSSWKVQKSPNRPDVQLEYLFGVSCTATRTCFAVGFSSTGSGVGQSLVLVSHHP
jgi:photosystem II stability/assembly factor-like uncharacterized protein